MSRHLGECEIPSISALAEVFQSTEAYRNIAKEFALYRVQVFHLNAFLELRNVDLLSLS